MDDECKFTIPDDIRERALKHTEKGKRVRMKPTELIELMDMADKALNGDSNDAEHDALFEIRERLSEIYEEPCRWYQFE